MHSNYTRFFIFAALSLLSLFTFTAQADDYKAKKTSNAPVIDGNQNDACWNTVSWSVINQVWDPQNATAAPSADYTGHYKAVWTPDKLYILMRVTDDKLVNWYPNEPLRDFWKSDCPEIFIDETRSKGDHRCNFNAYAYHISLDFKVVDGDASCNAQLFNDVLTGARTKDGTTYYWEFAINIYTDQYKLGASNNPKANLFVGKTMGFSIAYNDSDDQPERERMYGSQLISPTDPTYGTNVSYVNANYFGSMELMAEDITTALEDESDESSMHVFPTPASNQLTIQAAFPISSAKLMDPKGSMVYQQALGAVHSHTINLQPFAPGIYYLVIENGTQTVKRKIVIE